MKTVPLRGKKAADRVTLVDDGDYDLVMQYKWHVLEQVREHRTHGPYAHTVTQRDGHQKGVLMHTLLTGWPMVDHLNHDGLDNQRANLRPTTPLLNQHNKRGNLVGTSRFKGVCWDRDSKKWRAQISVGGHQRYLGLFSSEENAARIYDAAAWKAFGEFACLNFPGEAA